ncbi:hypothetical protein EniLVp02_0048 [Vibrio phage EniLVp02]
MTTDELRKMHNAITATMNAHRNAKEIVLQSHRNLLSETKLGTHVQSVITQLYKSYDGDIDLVPGELSPTKTLYEFIGLIQADKYAARRLHTQTATDVNIAVNALKTAMALVAMSDPFFDQTNIKIAFKEPQQFDVVIIGLGETFRHTVNIDDWAYIGNLCGKLAKIEEMLHDE